MKPGGRYAINAHYAHARAVDDELDYRVDVNTLDHARTQLGAESEIGPRFHFAHRRTAVVDRYRRTVTTGSFT